MVRSFTLLEEDIDLMKTAAIFCATIRGIPQFYYGTEILMTSPSHRDDGRIRSDFPGGWQDDEANAFTGEGLSEQQKDFQNFLKKLLQWRKSQNAIHHGDLLHYVPKDGVYVYFRYDDQDATMVILNKNQEPYKLGLDRFDQILSTRNSTGTDVISGDHIELIDHLVLSSKRSYVISID